MTDNLANQPPATNEIGFAQPRATASQARSRVGEAFRQGELIWLADETYDPVLGMWHFDVLRQGNFGAWLQQRYRFDEAADVVYFLGESNLSDTAFRTLRAGATLFPPTVHAD